MAARLILHVDLDAFYCQVEQVRLGIPTETPLAVQQWQNVIAVNYAARRATVTRHQSVQECLGKCPTMSFVHVATMSVSGEDDGQAYKQYTETRGRGQQLDSQRMKASLQPYRHASRAVFAVIEAFVGGGGTLERASVDEAFIEVTDLAVFDAEGCGGFIGQPCVDDPEGPVTEQDALIMKGTLLAARLRAAVYEELGYTMSAGVAKNKTLAKLASAMNKPNSQTYVLERHLDELMRKTPFSKIRFLGGKLGGLLDGDEQGSDDEDDGAVNEQYQQRFVRPSQSAFDLQRLSIDELVHKTGDRQSAEWVYQVIRGEDLSQVTARTDVKSFMSAKQFRPPCRDVDRAKAWLRLFANELSGRIDEELEETARAPQTLTLHFAPVDSATARTKSFGFVVPASGATADKIYTFVCRQVGDALLPTVVPVRMLGLSVTRFVEVQQSIDRFLCTAQSDVLLSRDSTMFGSASTKRSAEERTLRAEITPAGNNSTLFPTVAKPAKKHKPADKSDRVKCPKCSIWFEPTQLSKLQEHSDYHMAMDLARSL